MDEGCPRTILKHHVKHTRSNQGMPGQVAGMDPDPSGGRVGAGRAVAGVLAFRVE